MTSDIDLLLSDVLGGNNPAVDSPAASDLDINKQSDQGVDLFDKYNIDPPKEDPDLFDRYNIPPPVKASETVLMPDNSIVKAPTNIPKDSLLKQYDIAKNNNGYNYFGNVKIAPDRNIVQDFVAGARATATTIARSAEASSVLQRAETRKDVYSRPFEWSDLAFNPFAPSTTIPAISTTIAKLFLTKEQEMRQAAKQDAIIEAARRYNRNTRVVLEQAGITPNEDSGVAYDLGGAFSSILASVGITMMTKNPLAAAVLFSNIQKDSSYLEADVAGFSLEEKRAVSNRMALVEGVIEAIGGKVFLGLGKSDAVIKRILGRSIEEGIQEGAQTAGEELTAGAYGLRELDADNVVSKVAYSMFLGAIAGGGVSSLVEIGQKADINNRMAKTQKERLAERVYNYREKLQDRVAEVMNQEMDAPVSEGALKAVGNILNKYVNNKKVDIREEIDSIPNITNSEKEILISEMSDPSSPLNSTLDKQYFRGKMNAYKKDVKLLDNKIEALEKKITLAVDNGKDDSNLVNRLTDLNEQRAVILSDMDTLTLDLVSRDRLQAVKRGGSGTAEITANKLKVIENAQSRERIKKLSKMFTTVRRRVNKEGKVSREVIFNAIDNADLSKSEKQQLKASRKISKVVTKKQAEKEIAALEDKVVSIIEKRRKKEIVDFIKNTLKKTKLKKGGKTPKGKFADARAQKFFDELRDIVSLDKESSADLLEKMQFRDTPPSVNDAVFSSLLMYKINPDGVSVARLADIALNIRSIYDKAKSDKKSVDVLFDSYIEEMKSDVIDGLIASGKIDPEKRTGIKTQLDKKWRSARSLLSAATDAWRDVNNKFLGQSESGLRVSDYLDEMYHNAVMGARYDTNRFNKDLFEIAKREFFGEGKVRASKVIKKLKADTKVQNWGSFKFVNGKVKPLEMSVAEARTVYMQMKNADIATRLQSESGNGFTDKIIDFIENDILDVADRNFADAMLNNYRRLYEYANAKYEEVYGVSLPMIEFYSPVVSKGDTNIDEMFNPFLEATKERGSTVASFMMKRSNVDKPVQLAHDYFAATKYIAQVSHFVNSIDFAREANSVFMDSDVKDNIIKVWGKPALSIYEHYIYEATVGHNKKTQIQYNFANMLHRNAVVSVLGYKANLTPKQLVSAFTALAEVPIDSWVKAMVVFMKNPPRAIKEMSEFEYMKVRGSNQDYERAKSGMSDVEKLFPSKWRQINEAGLAPVRFGDRGGVYLGSWAVYYHNRYVLGRSKKESIVEFEKNAEKTQQSFAPNRLSMWQSDNNFIMKSITAFSTAPLGYVRIITTALRDYKRGNIRGAELAKVIAVYHFLLPQLFQYVSNAFTWDDDDQWRAMFIGNLNMYPIMGDAINNAFARAQGIYYDNPSIFALDGVADLTNEIADLVSDEYNEIASGEGKFSVADFFAASGLLVGSAFATFMNIGGGVQDIQEGDVVKGAGRIMGYTERVMDKATSKE